MSSFHMKSGLGFQADNFALKGVVCAVPSKIVDNTHFHATFGADAVDDVVKMIGVHERRWVDSGQTSADLCEAAAQSLLNELGWERDSVDALIFISQTPDYRLPATACALHGRLGLAKKCVAFDINLGCSGYVYGLWMASKLLDGLAVKRVLILAGDTISKTVDPADRSTALLFGDAGSASAIEYDREAARGVFVTGSEGAGAKNLIIPEGAYRSYGGDDPRLQGKSPACLYMDGGEIFNFTLSSIPALVNDTIGFSGVPANEVESFLFHQANTFMLKHIIKKSKIAPELAPINMDRFGNVSCASIPLLLVDKVPAVKSRTSYVAMFGFGVGYSWAGALLKVGPLKVSKLIEL
jgi:3-oxoacyl-[acyl-carrier-protein] synthase III